jgi:hypothetical protein
MIRVRKISDTSKRDERKICWCLDVYLWGYSAGGGVPGGASGRRAFWNCQASIKGNGMA